MSQPICSVVIPVYNPSPSKEEWASFRQVLTILGKYDCIIVCSDKFNPASYLQFARRYTQGSIKVVRFRAKYFSSIDGYNELLLRPFFYRKFSDYSHILIYQLDAWVFCDELLYWCKQGYDYIGAPWFEGWGKATASANFTGVGNGGLSLRNIQSHIKALTSFRYIVPPSELFKRFKAHIGIKSLYRLIRDLTFQNNIHYRLHSPVPNEDHFWGLYVAACTNFYKVPDMKTAMRFSMEVNGPMLYNLNNNQLPFGCHAWEKYDKAFWQRFIQVEA